MYRRIFRSDDPATDPAIVEEARRLSAEIEQTSQPAGHSPAAADELEAEFDARIKHLASSIVHVTAEQSIEWCHSSLGIFFRFQQRSML